MSDQTFCKLSIRTEGSFVNCYLAPAGDTPTTQPMYLLGCLQLNVVKADPDLFIEWKQLMKKVLVVAVRESLGIEIDINTMTEEPAADIERTPGGSGH